MNSLDKNKIMELTGGLKNALERGETLEDAIQSLKNAGYNSAEVIEASKKLKIIHEGEEKKQEQKISKKEKPNGRLFGLKKLFSKKTKSLTKKNNSPIINREKIIPKILPVKKPLIKQKNNFSRLRSLFSKKQPTPINQNTPLQKTIQQPTNQKTIPVKKPIIKPKRLIWIITVILSILILIGSAILGLYWDRWFG